ncbi:NAD(P)-dependent oxidoreductase [Mycolicibacterium sp. P9-64]|uniref:mycofactocin-coupled SDR family oxidoreductase n=1 Tax=Mycolicibacterium sp. P9-64 TaxID=2024612 RepID=UPI0011ED9EC9|nr:mycofactocin-coupled SDR family oxidoreductase [Mycolicibacterium sp. P9-64]KAA0086448.1 NAD(P)-dependent oxidoreductase [Mycolicibacterium sp. P9-64]
MSRRFEGKTALITGAARGQGRSHAIRLAAEGADIIAVDLCTQIESVPYALATPDDLAETVQQVKALGRRIHAVEADVRDAAAMRTAVAGGTEIIGPIDVVLANAGVASLVADDPNDEAAFRDTVDVNLAGVWHTVKAAATAMIEHERGGSIILTSSNLGLSGRGGNGSEGYAGYVASKHGVVGIMRMSAHWLSKYSIRVNSVHPTAVDTPMITNAPTARWFEQNPEAGTLLSNLMPVDMVAPSDVTNAILWLASDEARYVTGSTIPVDAGFLTK